jgi:hypothetical protein
MPSPIGRRDFLAAAAAVTTLASRRTGGFTIAQDGAPVATIIIASNPTPSAALASRELQHHIERIAGARLPIRTDEETVTGPVILVGESKATRALGMKGSDFAPQEYVVRFLPNALVLMGRDWEDTPQNRAEVGYDTIYESLQEVRRHIDYAAATGRPGPPEMLELPGYYDDQGTCYAVYHFLERFCGVRWLGPTELLASVPRQPTLTIRPRQVRRSPAFLTRQGTGGTWNWPIIDTQWNRPTNDQIYLFWRRLRMGGEKWAANHAFYRTYYERFHETHPEFFAQGRQLGPDVQLCYTNPGLIQQVAQDARNFFDGKGLVGQKPAMGNYFAVVPMDDANWCKCDRCQALLKRDEKQYLGDHFSSGTASHYLFHFVNEVAKEVHKTHPDRYIATLAYHVYSYPPTDFTLEPNVSVAPCLQVRNYWAPHIEAHEVGPHGWYRQWVEKRDRPIYLWNYYNFPMEPAVENHWDCFPGFSAHRLGALIKTYHRDGVRGVFLCGIGEQVDLYVTMRLYDDPSIPVDTLLAEFFTRAFGAAAPPMHRFYETIESIFSDGRNYPPEVREKEAQFHQNEEIAWKWLGTAERMAALGEMMAQAEHLADTDDDRRRVALWKQGVWSYMQEGRAKYLAGHQGQK